MKPCVSFLPILWIDFFFGTHWAPNIALRGGAVAADEDVGQVSGSYGMIPVMAGTLLIATIAMLVAVPVGLFAAIYMAEFASQRVRDFVKPTLEILAGIDSCLAFSPPAAAPFLINWSQPRHGCIGTKRAGSWRGDGGDGHSVYLSLSDDGHCGAAGTRWCYGLGSTKAKQSQKLLPAALPGLVGAFLLGISRAIGGTMIVVMAAGVSANLTANPLEGVTTVTVQVYVADR